MLDIFTRATNDQSYNYIGQIFGNVGVALAGSGVPILSKMFETFNTTLLTVGSLMVAYITVVGVMLTAAEGKFLGEKWHALWVPLRVVMGIAGLFPTSSGYCAIQVIIMWIIVQGIGMADQVWGTAVRYFAGGGKIFSGSPNESFNDPAGAFQIVMQKTLQFAVCEQAAVKLTKNDANATANATYDANAHTFNFGSYYFPSDPTTAVSCGTITVNGVKIPDPNNPAQQISDPLSIAQEVQAMQTIIPVVEVIAANYANLVINQGSCWSNTTITGAPCVAAKSGQVAGHFIPCTFFDKYMSYGGSTTGFNCPLVTSTGASVLNQLGSASNFVSDASKLFYGYAENYTIQAQQAKLPANTGQPNLTNQALNRAQTNGWIFAGAMYYYLAQQSGTLSANYQGFITGIAPNGSDPALPNPPGNLLMVKDMSTMALNIANAGASAAATSQSVGGGLTLGVGGSPPSQGAVAAQQMNVVTQGILSLFMAAITPDTGHDPIVQIQSFGQSLLTTADVLFWVFLVLVIVFGALSTPLEALGTSINVVAGVFTALNSFLMPIFYFIVGYLIVVGGMLGVYMPLVPYTLFTMGAIGWFLGVIEAMVAGPVIALGILSPGGQNELLSRAEPSVMILMNIFLRPTLMIFGLISAMLLAIVVVELINAAFLSVVASIASSMGMFECFIFIIAFAGLILTAINKCYTLIHVLPEKVLVYIGGTAISYGEAEGLAQMKEKVSAGAGVAKEAGVGAVKGTGESVVSGRKAAQKTKEEPPAGGGAPPVGPGAAPPPAPPP